MTAHVQLQEFYESAASILVPYDPDVFEPDGWTATLAKALVKLQSQGHFEGKHVAEVGVGTGINPAGILSSPRAPSRFTGGDVVQDAVDDTAALIKKNNLNGIRDIWIGSSDLMANFPKERLGDISTVFACIPQLPETAKSREELTDVRSHTYKPTGQVWDKFYLGLNSDLLRQARVLVPSADVILNLSGRPGLDTLKKFFDDHGYEAQVVQKLIVQNHKGSSVAAFEEVEQRDGHVFDFFADAAGTQRITVVEAEQRRIAQNPDRPVFHPVFAIRGTPKLAA